MATQIGEIFYKITGENSSLKSSLNESESAVNKTAEFFKKAAEFIGLAYAADKIKDFVKESIFAAAEAESTGRRFQGVYSGIDKASSEALQNLMKNYSLTEGEAQSMLSSNGQILQSMGLTKTASLDYSKSLAGLAVDLASFAGKSDDVEGANRALGMALAGNTRALREYNIVLKPDALKEFAAAMGEDITKMTEAEKANLTLQFIMQKTSGVTGDFTRNLYTWGNQLRIAKGNVDETQESIGRALLPTATALLVIFNKMIQPVREMADKFNEWAHSAEGVAAISEVLGTTFGTIAAIATILKNAVITLLMPLNETKESFSKLSGMVTTTTDKWEVFGKIVNIVMFALKVVGTVIAGAVTSFIDLTVVIIKTGQMINAFYDALSKKKSWDDFKKSAVDVGESFKTLGKNAVDMYIKLGKDTEKFVKDFKKDSDKIGKDIEKTYKEVKADTVAIVKEVAVGSKQAISGVSTVTSTTWRQTLNGMQTAAQQFATQTDKVFKSLGDGIMAIFGAIGQYYSAMTNSEIESLNRKMLAEERAANVADDTAVESAQKRLEAAISADDQEEIAAAQKALKKAQIEEAYQKQIAKVQYDGAMRQWKLEKTVAKIDMFRAPLSAFAATVGSAPAPWGIALAVAAAALSLAAATIKYNAVEQSQPQAPGFEKGGVIPGHSFSGDSMLVRANSAEMILTQSQQAKLLDLATKGGDRLDQNITIPVHIGNEKLATIVYNKTKSGEMLVHSRGIVSR